MKVKQLIAGAAITGGLGLAGLGLGAGIAYADRPAPRPGPVVVQPGQDRDAYDRASRDRRPFQYQGRWVTPVFDQGRQGWGFWLGPSGFRSSEAARRPGRRRVIGPALGYRRGQAMYSTGRGPNVRDRRVSGQQ